MPQVAVIGAGPAGSIAAILLARGGIDVTLIEQHRFPRDKVCGECISALGIEVLGRCGIRMTGVPLTQATFIAPGGGAATFHLDRPMLGISRAVLDQTLLESARSAGATVLQPARCESLDAGQLRVRQLETNLVQTIHADHVLVADGKSNLLPSNPRPTDDFGLKAHFVSVDAPPGTIEIFGVAGHYGGIAPIEGARFNIAFSVPRGRIQQHRGDLDSCFAAITHENRELRRQMHRARRVSDWLVSPLPRFGVRRDWPACVIPIGNAAAAIEPIGGEGMGLAMRSAELATEHLLRASTAGERVDTAGLGRAYCRLWNTRRLACRAAAWVVSSPRLCDLIIPFLSERDDFTAFALRALGKA